MMPSQYDKIRALLGLDEEEIAGGNGDAPSTGTQVMGAMGPVGESYGADYQRELNDPNRRIFDRGALAKWRQQQVADREVPASEEEYRAATAARQPVTEQAQAQGGGRGRGAFNGKLDIMKLLEMFGGGGGGGFGGFGG